MAVNDFSVPQVSVIIPLYNKAPYIKRAIDSVLSQTFQDFEIIIIGGKSSDGGEDIVRKYTDSRIHLVDEVGIGVSAARNQGVDSAISDLVAFLDADDEWYPEHLETIISLYQSFPDAGAYATGHVLVRDNIQVRRLYLPELGSRMLSSYFSARVRAGIRNQFIMTSSFAVRKNIFHKLGGFNISMAYGEDIDLYERISAVSKIAYSPTICMKYNYDVPGNTRTTVINYSSSIDTIVKRYDKLYDLVHTCDNPVLIKELEEYIGMNYSIFSFQKALRGYRGDSIKILKHIKSVKYIHLITVALILNIIPRKVQAKLMRRHYGL